MRVILIGRSEAGKTSLCQRIHNQDLKYHKTQTVQLFGDQVIDTPGEYLERRHYRGAVAVTAADADMIVFVQAANEKESMFPPAYASNFMKPVVGVITKCDLADQEDILRARLFLQLAGAGEVFETSSLSGEGIKQLADYFGLEK